MTVVGLIVDDPNRTLETDIINENYIDDRNQCGDVYVANGLRNTESDPDKGVDNLWTWDRLGDVVLEYVKVISKPE